jgi:type IV pilus assembly protein PilB
MAAAQEASKAVRTLEEVLGREVLAPTDVDSPEEAQVTRVVNAILSVAIEAGASDIHIEAQVKESLVRQRLDGVLHEMITLPFSLHGPVVDRLKKMADMDVVDKRLPQDGRIHLKYQDRSLDVRVASLPSAFGEALTMRLLAQSDVMISFDRLGFVPDDEVELKSWLTAPNGLMIITGPTGSGKTTVLYSCLQHVAGPQKKTLTIEDPVEYNIPHTTQTHVHAKVGLTYATALRAFLRQDPDVIMVGELRDKETVDIAMQAAMTGHLVMSMMHTNSAAGTITRLLDLGIEPFLFGATLLGITAQRLVRCVCDSCREEYEVPDVMLANARALSAAGGYEIPQNARFTRGRGCAMCRNTGYRRRIGIYEVLPISEEISGAILQRASTHELHELAIKQGMVSIFADGVRKAVDGVTTLDEVMRVTGTTA